MKQLIAGLVMVTATITATADNTRADKIEYCYSMADLAETIAVHRNQQGSISKLMDIVRDTEGGEQFESIVILIYENPDQSPREIKKVFLEVCLANMSKPSQRRET